MKKIFNFANKLREKGYHKLAQNLTSPFQRFDVHVLYPTFDNQGNSIFDSNGVDEYVTLTRDELNEFKQKQKQGYLKILNIEPRFPRSPSYLD